VDRSQACHEPSAEPVIKFINTLIYRFGVPHSIITKNGSNFTADISRILREEPHHPRLRLDGSSIV
jgi:hypothetical protein